MMPVFIRKLLAPSFRLDAGRVWRPIVFPHTSLRGGRCPTFQDKRRQLDCPTTAYGSAKGFNISFRFPHYYSRGASSIGLNSCLYRTRTAESSGRPMKLLIVEDETRMADL